MLLFLLVHVGDTALVRLGPAYYDAVVATYRNAAFRALEIVLMGAVLFHSFNGLRIVVIDLWPGWLPFNRALVNAAYLLTAACWLPAAYFMAVR